MKHFFCNLLFRDDLWGVDALFYIYHMTSFNYNAKEARDVDLCCRCHLSDSQIVSSAFCVTHARENNLLVIVCKFMYICYCCCYVFNSVVLFFCLFVCLSLLLSFAFFFFRDISLNTYVIEAVKFSGRSMILANLCKTWTIRD